MKGVRYTFPHSIVEFTYPPGNDKTPEGWVKAHLDAHARQVAAGTATAEKVEEFESDVPVMRAIPRS